MKRLIALCLLLPALATAHAVEHPRRLLLKAKPGQLEIQFVFELDPQASRMTRRLFDRDRDGVVRGSELEMLQGYLERRAVGTFELSRDDQVVKEDSSRGELAGVNESSANLAVRVSRTWGLAAAAEKLSVQDGGDSEGHVPVRIEAEGVEVRFGAVKLGKMYDLPARTAVSLVIRRED